MPPNLSTASRLWSRPPRRPAPTPPTRSRCAAARAAFRCGSARSRAPNSSESDDVSLRVFVGKRVASVSATAASDPHDARRARRRDGAGCRRKIPIRASPIRRGWPRRSAISTSSTTTEIAGRAAEGGRACRRRRRPCRCKGVTNSGGSGASAGLGGLVLATSHGFVGQYVGSRFSRSASVIAGEGTGDGARLRIFLAAAFRRSRQPPKTIGRKAGERAVRRLNARKAQDRTGRR